MRRPNLTAIALLSNDSHDLEIDQNSLEQRVDEQFVPAVLDVILDQAEADIDTLNTVGQIPKEQLSPAMLSMILGNIRYRNGLSDTAVSTESIQTVSGSNALVLEAQSLSEELQDRLFIAQEGIFSDAKDRIEEIFLTAEKIAKKLEDAHEHYSSGTPKAPEELIENPRWGKYFYTGSDKITGKQAMQLLIEIDKYCKDHNLITAIDELGGFLKSITKNIRDTWFVASKENIEQIKNWRDEIENIRTSMQETLHYSRNSANVRGADAVPLNEKDESALYAEAIKLAENREFETAIHIYRKISRNSQIWYMLNSGYFRVGGMIAGNLGSLAHGDIRAARMALNHAFMASNYISNIIDLRSYTINAVVQYINASVK